MWSPIRQFACPSGLLGRLAGRIMASWNAEMNRFVTELMAVQPDDHILEIGFGPGENIQRQAALAAGGLVAGVDPSATMLAQARGRNAAAVRAGRVELKRGSISALPYPDGAFDKLCTINTVYFWPDPPRDVAEIFRVLRPGGGAFIAFRVRSEAPDVIAVMGRLRVPVPSVAALQELLAGAGFDAVSVETRALRRVTACCVMARRPA